MSLSQRSRAWVRRLFGAAAELVFPPVCAACGMALTPDAQRPWLCTECLTALTPEPVVRCGRCAGVAPQPTTAEEGCVLCQGERLYFDAVATLGSYDGALREAVLRMKRPYDQPLAQAVADLLVENITEQVRAWQVDVVLPVPMHWRQRLLRGVNSPDLLASVLARAWQTTWATGVLSRRRHTVPQTSVPPSERFHNVRHAFKLGGNVEWDGLHVLLVDDILTTGATCSELARLLRQAGAATVHVAVVCRAQGKL